MAEGKEFSYDDDNLGGNGERYIIMSDVKQQIPRRPLRVTKTELRMGRTGKEYPVLTLQDADGNNVACAAWKRDVSMCIKEWGKNPILWGDVEIVVKGKRLELWPCDEQRVEIEKIA